jgi:hypothetical protein
MVNAIIFFINKAGSIVCFRDVASASFLIFDVVKCMPTPTLDCLFKCANFSIYLLVKFSIVDNEL